MPWQSRDHVSPRETEFRRRIESRKDQLLAGRLRVRHPVLLDGAQLETARSNIAGTSWGREWFDREKSRADDVLRQGDGYIERMIPSLTPTNPYGFTCPNCVGDKSLEGAGISFVAWDPAHPDRMSCKACGQIYPDARFPETAILTAPRRDQTFSFYLNSAQCRQPDDRTGRLAWKWVGYPIHVSFSGIIRHEKIRHMIGMAHTLGVVHQLTGSVLHARAAIRILLRFAECMPNWLYHDYWDTFADCDPLYAAWHDKALPLEWKRHLAGSAYEKDEDDRAGMLQSFWGAGRTHPGADTTILNSLIPAYDMVADACDEDGGSLWNASDRRAVEGDLILEQLFTGEPFIGGPGKADNLSNKGPYVYYPMALAGRILGLAEFAHVALSGYEGLRDQSFLADGFSRESPAYTGMFLRGIINVPDVLDGFRWPENFPGRAGVVCVFCEDPAMRRIMRSAVESLAGSGALLPLSDTLADSAPPEIIFEIGLRRYPDLFAGALPSVYRVAGKSAVAAGRNGNDGTTIQPSQYAIFNLREADIMKDELNLPEMFFPAWMTAILRHGNGAGATEAALSFNPPGNHRHSDNLGLYYAARGRAVLAEQGYIGDSALLQWDKSTLSHNLVVVDDQEQLFGGETPRIPEIGFMVSFPDISIVEAESRAYIQCSVYRRLIAMIKGPREDTVLIDIFRVRGGKKHAYRVFSDIAASDAPGGAMELPGLGLRPPARISGFGGSVDREHVFGLRDMQVVDHPPAAWQAVWRENQFSYRLHMMSKAAAAVISHGPGQLTNQQIGRRVRYLDVVNQGCDAQNVLSDAVSTFVAVHEPSGSDGRLPVLEIGRLDVPPAAGSEAVAVRLRLSWGDYLILNEFEQETAIEGVRFAGRFGVLADLRAGDRRLFAAGASTLAVDGMGFSGAPVPWTGIL